jgi:hypothetical protein
VSAITVATKLFSETASSSSAFGFTHTAAMMTWSLEASRARIWCRTAC